MITRIDGARAEGDRGLNELPPFPFPPFHCFSSNGRAQKQGAKKGKLVACLKISSHCGIGQKVDLSYNDMNDFDNEEHQTMHAAIIIFKPT